jgi:hypothetical protein
MEEEREKQAMISSKVTFDILMAKYRNDKTGIRVVKTGPSSFSGSDQYFYGRKLVGNQSRTLSR